ncbi:MAG TPA: DUF4394 domain-containing protein [Longimicrobium sp.]|jgi:hypothetical protein
MKRTIALRRALVAVAASFALAACEDDSTGPSFEPQGRRVFAIDAAGNLLTFGTQNPNRVRSVAITGLASGETLQGIDFRPANGQLIGVGSSSRVYVVDTLTAAASALGSASFTPALAGSSFGFDFNPTVDRIRLHGSAGQNLRLHPETGVVAATDTALSYTTDDSGAFVTPRITATAYTNSVAGATTTQLFGIDSNRDVLVFVEAPNGGRMRTRGTLGVNTSDDAGFDIVGADAAREVYAALTVGGQSNFYTIDLATGRATFVGGIGTSSAVRGIAVAP